MTVGSEDVPVVIGVGESRIRLSAGGDQIGDWAPGECLIEHVGEDVYIINVENESLRFVPNDPHGFASALNGSPQTAAEEATPVEPTVTSEPSEAPPATEPPQPKPLTMVAFYVLAAITAGLGLWALVSLVF